MAPHAQRPEPFSGPASVVAAEPPAADGEPLVVDAGEPLVVDCDRCIVRGGGCPDCVVTFLLGGPPDDVLLDADEQRALDVLATAGLIPPLRMVRALDSRSRDDPP